jgi:hypothetical protein
MQRLKNISKATLVIIVLIVLNIVAFSAISTRISHTKEEVAEISSNPDNNSYFKSGVNVLNWSYTLLKYFRR